ncbi:MAG: hypothetical protein DRJ43_01080 [Thermoprotei archaeon]|nr:MAG: hypothetical protein DRJ43_01080 [Thermoprotei archaeon]
MQAPRFREKGRVREFMTDDGKSYIVIGFPDGSALVLQKIRGKGKAVADFKPVSRQKEILEKLGACREGKDTYQMAWELLREG